MHSGVLTSYSFGIRLQRRLKDLGSTDGWETRWHSGHKSCSAHSSVTESGAVLAAWSLPLGDEKRPFHLHEFQRHFREYFQSSVLAMLRKRARECVCRNEAESPLLAKSSAGSSEGERCVFVISPRTSLRLHNVFTELRGKRRRWKGSEGRNQRSDPCQLQSSVNPTPAHRSEEA